MDLAVWQIILLVILAACTILDALTLVIGLNFPVITGTLAGIIMGDMVLGLAIGATLQLMVLGVGTYGGASIPDFTTGAIVGTVFAVLSGQDAEFAIGLAIPVGLLMVQLDILARFTNTFSCTALILILLRATFRRLKGTFGMGRYHGLYHARFPYLSC